MSGESIGLPIQSRKAEELADRARFFKEALELTIASRAFRGADLMYHNSHPDQLAHVYFALHDAYKGVYIRKTHLSDQAKRAAMTAAAVIAVSPIHRNPDKNDPVIERKPWELADADYPNPFLAVRAACAIVDHPFHKRTWDDRRRVYCSYVGFEFPTVEPIIEEARRNSGAISTNWPITDLTPQEDGRLRRHRLEVGPARFGRDPENVQGAVFVRLLRIGVLLALRVQLGVLRLEGIGDVFQEDQPKHDVLVFRRIHVVAQRVRGGPKLRLEAEIGGAVRCALAVRSRFSCHLLLLLPSTL